LDNLHSWEDNGQIETGPYITRVLRSIWAWAWKRGNSANYYEWCITCTVEKTFAAAQNYGLHSVAFRTEGFNLQSFYFPTWKVMNTCFLLTPQVSQALLWNAAV